MKVAAFGLLVGLALTFAVVSAAEEAGVPGPGTPPAAAMPGAVAKPLDLAGLRRMRREAAHRRRRIIFNNDGDDVIYTKKDPTPEALLALRTSPLLGSQVDSIFYSNSMCFGQALHNSRVMEPFTCTDGIFKDNSLPELLARGLEPIRIMAEFCHAHGLESFWDMRMNDTHDSMLGGYGPYLRPRFKTEHPECLVGSVVKQPPHGTWSSVDYAVPQVREMAYRFFEEVCQRFDVDGIELDFFRHACFFRSVAWGGRATPEELAMMTDLVRRTRAMTEREGMRRGRPILIAIRVPDSVEYCRGIGLDVEEWLADGLVDILSGTCYFQLEPWESLVQLGHRYGVPVYPSLSDSRVKGETRFSRGSLESYRGRALQAWSAGADGVYLFNYFNPRGAIWRELGDPAALRTRDKLYFATTRNGSPQSYLAGGDAFRKLPVLTPSNPWLVPEDKPVEVEVFLGDDFPPTSGALPQVTCHVRTLGGRPVVATLNGRRLGDTAAKEEWLDFPVPLDCVRKGANRVALSAAGAARPAGRDGDWDVVYEGTHLPAPPWHKEGFLNDRECIAEVQDGKLLVADRGKGPGSYSYFRCPCFIRPGAETVVEARLKPISGWSSVIIENGVAGEEICFYPDQVKARHSGLSYALDAAGDFHTYRIAIREKSYQVFVDGALRLDGAGRLTRPAPAGRSGVMFGGANSPETGEALWEFVKIRNPAVTLLDLVLSVRYGAG